jgi:hypothetical protein
VFDLLAREGISFVAVGELPLVLAGYSNPYLRRIGDLDIVVSPAQAQAAARLINGTNWRAGLLAAEEITYRSMRRFIGPAARTLYLRWHFISAAATARVDDYFRSRCEAWDIQGVPALRLSGNAALLHFLLSDIPPLINQPSLWSADALALLRNAESKATNWSEIVDFAVAEKLAARLRHRLSLLAGFSVDLPEEVLQRLTHAPASLPEVIEGHVLRRHHASSRWSVFADYLRSRNPTALTHGMKEFPHFLRHRWELKGRGQIFSAIGRYLVRRVWRGDRSPKGSPAG